MNKVLVLGGYGNFGKRITKALIRHGVPVVIAGRDQVKAEALASELNTALLNIAVFDVNKDLSSQLQLLRPSVVINTCGPFQASNYLVALCCLNHGVHYIDLADGRDFVNDITMLDNLAKSRNVTVISGASTVPGLSSAVVEYYRNEFSEIDSMKFGISPGQQAERGLATTQGILSYVGKPLKLFAGSDKPRYGWQNIYRQEFPELGKRWMANCDIPDLDLLPKHYGIRSIQFSAGLEIGFIHLGLWFLSWVVRIGLPLNLSQHAKFLLEASNKFNKMGSADGGMFVILKGKDHQKDLLEKCWFIIGKDGDGPQIPCVPAIILAHKLASGEQLKKGAYPCVGLITLDEYMNELEQFNIYQIK